MGELESLVVLHPLGEHYWRLSMLVLYRTARQGEALRRAKQFRSILANDLGLDAPPAIRDLESRILVDDPDLRVTRVSTSPHVATGASRQLLGATSFIGRDPDVTALAAALRGRPLVASASHGSRCEWQPMCSRSSPTA